MGLRSIRVFEIASLIAYGHNFSKPQVRVQSIIIRTSPKIAPSNNAVVNTPMSADGIPLNPSFSNFLITM